jgi:hypothetical protein
MIDKKILFNLYNNKNLSMKEISVKLNCSINKIVYWMDYYEIKRRSISESVYIKNNPNGDPFSFRKPETKANKYSIRLGNTDPDLLQYFILFLVTFFNISTKDMKFGVQIFSTMSSEDVISFWTSKLNVPKEQFMKVIVTEGRGEGTYSRKIEYGVLTVYYNNKKMRDILVKEIENMREIGYYC